MKKSFKQAFALLISTVMLLALVPGAFAADTTSKLPTGNSDGRLIEAGMTVRVGNDDTMDAEDFATYTDGAVLADGFHFAAAEILNYKDAADISGESDSIILNTPDGKTATTGTRTLNSTNNTIEFEWETAKSVKRLEMWVWPVGAIKDYEIQYFNGTDWVEEYATGTFDQTQPAPALDAANYEGKRAVSYIMTFDEVNTKKLRFIAKSFKTGYTSAKIGEAVPRSNNNVNLLATYAMTKRDTVNGWLDAKQGNTNAGYNSKASPYALNFGSSKVDTRTDFYYCYNNGAFTCASPIQANYTYSPCAVSYDATAGLWYAVRLTDSPQKVNKVTFTVKTGTIRKFEIWCNTATSADISSKKAAPSGGTWKLMTTVTGSFESGTVAEAYIPKTVVAEYWMIKVTDCDTNAQFIHPGLYVLHQGTSLFGNGATFGENNGADILTDSFYYVGYDNLKMDDPDVKKNLDKVAKFTSINSGIQYTNEVQTTETVKRLDLWILNDGGIENYHVETSYDGKVWNTIKSGTFTKDKATPVNNSTYKEDGSVDVKAGTFASYYPIIFDSPVKAKYIKFVIDSFYDNTKGAYISQAILRDTNEINLAAHRAMPNKYNETNYWSYSPYIVGFSGTTGAYSYDGVKIWGHWGTGYEGEGMKKEDGNLYYATTFGASRVKVNRVGINLRAGSITQFEVWRGLDDTGQLLVGSNNIAPLDTVHLTKNQYKRIAVIDCNITKENDLLFDLPYAEEADAYMIKVTACSDDANIASFDFYALADSELTPSLTDAKLTGDVIAEQDVEFSVRSCNNEEPYAAVFFALYSGEELVAVAKKACALSGIDTFTATYTVPKDKGDNLSLRAMLWNSGTLVPILQQPAVAPAANVE